MKIVELRLVPDNKKGIVDYSALKRKPEPHEEYTAEYFARRGYDVTFLKTSNIKGSHSPDFLLIGRIWETKSPITYSDSSFEDNFKKAEKQSGNVIFDLRRLNKKNESRYLKNLIKRSTSNKIKTLLVINREEKLLTIKGTFGKIKT